MIVKVCGIKRQIDIIAAADAGVDWLGFNLWPGSKRHVALASACSLAAQTKKSGLKAVALLVEPTVEQVREVADTGSFDYLQIYCPPDPLPLDIAWVHAYAVDGNNGLPKPPTSRAKYHLLEAKVAGFGGAGQTFDWQLLKDVVFMKPTFIAGGITPDNIEHLLNYHQPFGIDVASGVEVEPGVKDPMKMRTIVKKAKKVK